MTETNRGVILTNTVQDKGQSEQGDDFRDEQSHEYTAKKEGLFSHLKKVWFEFYPSHRNQVIYGTIGLLIAMGFLIAGFWPTLLLAVFIFVGVLYGRYRDGDRRVMVLIRRIIDRLD